LTKKLKKQDYQPNCIVRGPREGKKKVLLGGHWKKGRTTGRREARVRAVPQSHETRKKGKGFHGSKGGKGKTHTRDEKVPGALARRKGACPNLTPKFSGERKLPSSARKTLPLFWYGEGAGKNRLFLSEERDDAVIHLGGGTPTRESDEREKVLPGPQRELRKARKEKFSSAEKGSVCLHEKEKRGPLRAKKRKTSLSVTRKEGEELLRRATAVIRRRPPERERKGGPFDGRGGKRGGRLLMPVREKKKKKRGGTSEITKVASAEKKKGGQDARKEKEESQKRKPNRLRLTRSSFQSSENRQGKRGTDIPRRTR